MKKGSFTSFRKGSEAKEGRFDSPNLHFACGSCSLSSFERAAGETLLKVGKSYLPETAKPQNLVKMSLTYRKIPWQLNIDGAFPGAWNYQGISYFCYCLSGCNETV